MSLHRDWSHSNPFPRQQSSVTQAQGLGTSRGLVTPPPCHTQRVGLSQESLPRPGTNWCHRLCHRSLPSPDAAAPGFQASPLATSGASSPLLATAGSSAPGSGGSTEPWEWCGRGTWSERSSGEGQHKIRKGFMGLRLEQPQTSLLPQARAEVHPSSPGSMLSPGTEQEHPPGQPRAPAWRSHPAPPAPGRCRFGTGTRHCPTPPPRAGEERG